ncbi:abortive infection system antitoxin AbiGi family protein [Pseudomonas gingeri]|uniref:abortive infection system antitoxin AbiGi family protein n=1 Tax=Pseudomonas gingeri TaxID=117681 RepID=UPI0034E9504A
MRHTKNYEADLNRGGKSIPNYRFSDEREWRFVPSIDNQCSMVFGLDYASQKENANVIELSKTILEKEALTFEPNDIKYIIIENDDEISDFLDFLRKAKGKSYTYHDIEQLMTRILTAEQIFTDI